MNNRLNDIFIKAKDNIGSTLLVDPSHPGYFSAGYFSNNEKVFCLNCSEVKLKFPSTKLIEVKIVSSSNDRKTIMFILKDDSETDKFYKFCNDLIEVTRNSKEVDIVMIVHKRWLSWINMFKNPHSLILGEKEIKGLIGELLYLYKYMFLKYSIEESVDSWMGPLNNHKDIEIGDRWYEIKTTIQNPYKITISSISQLDSELDGYLVVVELESTNKYFDQKITLNSLVKMISNKITNINVKQKFEEKLSNVGYVYFDEYDNYIYRIVRINTYLVNDNFPRLKKEHLPKAILTASYDLNLKEIENFLVEEK